MKIRDVKTTVFKHTLQNFMYSPANKPPQYYKKGAVCEQDMILATIESDKGIEGHCIVGGSLDQARFIDAVFKPLLVGQDPLDREKLWQTMWYARRNSNFDEKLLGVVDVALYDLAGKAFGVPVYKLLGGYRDKVLAYFSSLCGDDEPDGLSTPEAFANQAESCLKQGFKAYKIHPWGHPNRDIEACKAIRERVGEKLVLMIDVFSAYDLEEAIRVGRELEKLNFYWFEEPMVEYKIYAYKKLAKELSIPILVTEGIEGNLYSTTEYILREAGDMMRTDTWIKGGITPAKKTAALCEAFGLKCEIHLADNALMDAACLHLAGSVMNCEYYELGMIHPILGKVSDFAVKDRIDIDRDGYVRMPTKPGLGLEIDWDYIRENTVKR